MTTTTTTTTPTTTTLVASRLAVTVFGAMAMIQLGIAVGLLPVTIVWGGSQHERTWQNSVASVVAAALLLAMAWIIHARATTTTTTTALPRSLRVAAWMVTGYMALNTLGNALSPTFVERYIFGTMTVVLAICSGIVASSSSTTVASLSSSSAPIDKVERTNYQSIS